MRASIRQTALILVPALLPFVPLTPLAAASTAKGGSGFFATRNDTETGSATWRFSTPNFRDIISWTSGANRADGTDFVETFQGAETKFLMAVPPAGRVLTGFGPISDVGPRGSRATTSGGGASTTFPGTLWGTNYSVDWWVNATGTRGTGGLTSWKSRARADDPFAITPADLSAAGITESSYDIYFAAALESGSDLGVNGSIQLQAFYDDAAGSTKLLDIQADAGGVTVTSDNPAGLSFYLLSSVSEGPTEIGANLTTLAGIQSALLADLGPDGDLDSSLSVGIYWDSIPVPTSDLGDGSVATIRVETEANDNDGGCDDFSSNAATIPWMSGADVTLELNAGPAYAGRSYVIIGSLSGNVPGLPLPGGSVVLPVNWDLFSQLTLSLANSPILPNSFGHLDGSGHATAGFNTLGPVPPSTIGFTLDFAYALTAPTDYASCPVRMTVVP